VNRLTIFFFNSVCIACWLAMPAWAAPGRASKSCSEIAGFIVGARTDSSTASAEKDWNCAAARNVPQDAPLELTHSAWNPGLKRWEFVLRCLQPGDCAPFLVWARRAEPQENEPGGAPGNLSESPPASAPRLIKAGETAILTWEGGGLRIALQVTCLDAGSLGQTVRVRLKNAARVVRAEITGAGTVRGSL
jgi:Chaperone for flagella basal body P-ring formation